MMKIGSVLMAMFVLLAACAPAQSISVPVPEPDYWPTSGWQSSTPEAQGMDSSLLVNMLENISAEQSKIYSILVVRNGYLVTEAYFHPYTRQTKHHVQSVTKSVIGMLVGKAIDLGSIKSAHETLVSFFPGRVFTNSSEKKDSIQLAHLLSMSSGLDCAEFSPSGPSMEQSASWVSFMLDLPVVSTPGEKFGYCNGNAHLLSSILEKTIGMTAREYANQELFQPLGIAPVDAADWAPDPKGYTNGGYGLHLLPSDLAKLGFLYLHNGKWEDQQLIPTAWVAESTTQHVLKEDGSGYGYLWTVYPKTGHYAALGLGGQQIHVYPAQNLVVVVTAGVEAYAEAPEIEKMLDRYILPAVKSDRPLEENSAGAERLQAALEKAGNPLLPPAELPETALDISGSVYTFEENPMGWQTMQLDFTPGADAAQLILNGGPVIQVGLDNLFRLSNVAPFGELLLRGRWVDERTFSADYPYPITGPTRLGELGETEMRFQFTGERLDVTITPTIFGGEPFTISAKR